MHIHKPDDALLLLGHASRAGRPVLTVTVGYACASDGSRLSEQEAWQWLMRLFPDEPFDLFEKKAGGGFGVAGDACAPAGTQVEGLSVRAGVGPLKSHVLVQGDRRWTRTVTGWQPTSPQPFERMSVGLARAYGGPEWRDNPHGRGHGPIDTAEGRLLPNVEHPEHPVLAPSDTPPVATLGAQPMGSSGRDRWLGTIDEAWMRHRMPWLPDDTDPRWFDRFPAQQCQQEYWRGDEPWFVENMHPQRSVLQGRLPALRPRLLLRTVSEPDRHVELKLDLDTVWLMPNDERVVVLYRAQTEVRREDAKDILGLAVFTEDMAMPPRSSAEWSAVWRRASGEDREVSVQAPAARNAAAVDAVQAAKAEAEARSSAHLAALEKQIDEALVSGSKEIEDQLHASGFDVAALKARGAAVDSAAHFKPVAPMQASDLPRDPDAYEAALDARIRAALTEGEDEARAYLEQQGFDVDALSAHGKANTIEPGIVAIATHAAALLPIAESGRQAYVEQAAKFEQTLTGLKADLQEQFDAARQDADAARQRMEQSRFADPAALPTGPRERLTRDMLLERAEKGESAAWVELQGLDLSGVSLLGLDLRGAVLSDCDLRGTMLDEADLSGALIANCAMLQARMERVSFRRVQLQTCELSDARLIGADFSEANIQATVFDGADLTSSRWDDASLTECAFEAAVLMGAMGKRARYKRCKLPAINASESRFGKCDFDQCTFDGARFSRATLNGSTFTACGAAHAQFDQANLQGLRTLLDTRLDQANFSGADLQDASFQNTSLEQAVLREACLDRALVKECDLSGTDAWRMVARQADFSDSRIERASWRGANLMQATLGYTSLLDTDLSGANLHAAQTRTATVQGLVLTGALMTRCRLLQEYGEQGHG